MVVKLRHTYLQQFTFYGRLHFIGTRRGIGNMKGVSIIFFTYIGTLFGCYGLFCVFFICSRRLYHFNFGRKFIFIGQGPCSIGSCRVVSLLVSCCILYFFILAITSTKTDIYFPPGFLFTLYKVFHNGVVYHNGTTIPYMVRVGTTTKGLPIYGFTTSMGPQRGL